MIADSSYHGLPDPEMQAEFYADIPLKRLVAWVVDTVVILVLTVVALPLTAFLGLFFFPFLVMVIGFLYRWATLARGSATWGMRMTAIEIRTREGYRLDSMTAMLHTLIYSFALTSVLLQLVSIFLILTSERRQSLGDHLLGTAALNRAAGH